MLGYNEERDESVEAELVYPPDPDDPTQPLWVLAQAKALRLSPRTLREPTRTLGRTRLAPWKSQHPSRIDYGGVMDVDMILEFDGKRVRVPVDLATHVPQAAQALCGVWGEKGKVVLAFVTREPTAEAIVSEGKEQVASIAVSLTFQQFPQYLADLNRRAGELPQA